MLSRVGGLVACFLLLVGCGDAGSQGSIGSGSSTTTTTTTRDGTSRSDDPRGGEPATAGEDTPSEGAPSPSEPAGAGGGGSGSEPLSGEPPEPTGIVTSVSPLCAGRGDPVRVVVNTDPLADVSYAVAFSDGSSGNLFGLAQADLRGTFVWNFVIPADAATGDADVIVTSAHPDNGAKTGQGTIRVTESGACP